MKLDKIGKLYKANSENKLINNKDEDNSQLLTNLVNVVLDYLKLHLNFDYHSLYLRGSCLELDVTDKRIFDMDISVVHQNKFFNDSEILEEHMVNMIEKMNELYKFSLYPDIKIFSKPLWLNRPIDRFCSKKVEGSEDLSITSLDIDEALLYYKKIINEVYIEYISRIRYRGNRENIRMIIKMFYRTCGGLELLKNKMFSRSIYYCHTALVEKYPHHSHLLQELVHLFVNSEDCDNLDKYEETITSIYNGQLSNYKHNNQYR